MMLFVVIFAATPYSPFSAWEVHSDTSHLMYNKAKASDASSAFGNTAALSLLSFRLFVV